MNISRNKKESISPIAFKKKLALFLAGFVFLWHVTAILVVISPVNPLMDKIQPAAEQYLRTFFPQNWQFFAPDPSTSSSYFFYRCHYDDQSSSLWFDPGAHLLKEHKKNRISYNGKLLFLYFDIIRKLDMDSESIAKDLSCDMKNDDCRKEFEDHLRQSPSHQLATRFTSDLCRVKAKTANRQLHSVEFKTLTKSVVDFNYRHNPLAKGQTKIDHYPSSLIRP